MDEEEGKLFIQIGTRDDAELYFTLFSIGLHQSVEKLSKLRQQRARACVGGIFSFLNNIFLYRKKTCAHINRALNYKKYKI